MSLALGHSFFNTPTDTIPRHLWVLVSDPAQSERVVIVNFSTNPGNNDPPCLVQPDEHPSLSHPSYVRCDEVRLTTRQQLEAGVAKGVLTRTKAAPPELIAKLQRAIVASERVSNDAKRLMLAQGFGT